MRAAEAAAAARPAADFSALRRAGGGLAPLAPCAAGAGAGAEPSPATAAECARLRGEVDALRTRLQALQASATAALRDKSDAAQRVEAAEAAAAAAARDAAARGAEAAAASRGASEAALAEAQAEARAALDVADAARGQLAALQAQLRARDGSVAAAEAAAAAAAAAAGERLQVSKQFQLLQLMMRAKSAEVVSLRRRLAKYEPDTVASADEAVDGA